MLVAVSLRKPAKAASMALAIMIGAISISSNDLAAQQHSEVALTELEIAAIKIACEDLSEEYSYYLDGKDPENLAGLFAEDGVWEVLGNRMEGREQIRDYWAGRSAGWAPGYGRVHMMGNQVVRVIDRDHAVGQSVVLIYMFNTPNAEPQSLAPNLISRNDDEYVRTPTGWKFKRRTISTVAMQEPRH